MQSFYDDDDDDDNRDKSQSQKLHVLFAPNVTKPQNMLNSA